MKRLSKDLFSLGVALLFIVIAVEFVWQLVMEFKAAIVIGLLVLFGSYIVIVIRRYMKANKDDDSLDLGGWD